VGGPHFLKQVQEGGNKGGREGGYQSRVKQKARPESPVSFLGAGAAATVVLSGGSHLVVEVFDDSLPSFLLTVCLYVCLFCSRAICLVEQGWGRDAWMKP